jgi:CRISPR system Cascade subunit CasB
MTDHDSWQGRLVANLVAMSDPSAPDRATLAHLRRGLGQPLDYTLGRVGWLFAGVPDRAVEMAVLAAGLFALTKGDCPHSRPSPNEGERQRSGPNFGAAFGDVPTDADRAQREKRFIDLLDTGPAELPHKLRQAVTLVARDGTRLDWHLLIDDLLRWDHPDRWVQKDWARGYWANRADADEPTAATPTASA